MEEMENVYQGHRHIDKLIKNVESVLAKSVLGQSRPLIYIRCLQRGLLVSFYSGLLLLAVNICLFLSLAVRLKKFDPVLIAFLSVAVYPVLFYAWERLFGFVARNKVFHKSLILPQSIRMALASLALASSVLMFFGGLIGGVSLGQALLIVAGIIGACLFYQWFSVLVQPDLLGISFLEGKEESSSLVFADWVLFKCYIIYFLLMELSVVIFVLASLLLIIDLVSVWTASPSSVYFVYSVALWHQALWIGSLLLPIIGYLTLQGWVFVVQILKNLWFCRKETKNEGEDL